MKNILVCIVCQLRFLVSPVSRTTWFPGFSSRKLGEVAPLNFHDERKIANELASTSNLYLFECSILSRQVTRTMVTRQYFLVSKILSMRPLNGQKHDEIFRYENFWDFWFTFALRKCDGQTGWSWGVVSQSGYRLRLQSTPDNSNLHEKGSSESSSYRKLGKNSQE